MVSSGMCTHMVPHGTQAPGVPMGRVHTRSLAGHRQGCWERPRDLPSTRPNATKEIPLAHGTNPCRSPTQLPAHWHPVPVLCHGFQAAPKVALARLWQKKERRCQCSLSVPSVPDGTKLPARARCSLPMCCEGAPHRQWLGSAHAIRHCSVGPSGSAHTTAFGKHR